MTNLSGLGRKSVKGCKENMVPRVFQTTITLHTHSDDEWEEGCGGSCDDLGQTDDVDDALIVDADAQITRELISVQALQ